MSQHCVSQPAYDCHHCLQDPTKIAALQPVLEHESALLDDIYSAALYGGATLPDSLADGSNDKSTGGLFENSP
jgi:hypothetical protein